MLSQLPGLRLGSPKSQALTHITGKQMEEINTKPNTVDRRCHNLHCVLKNAKTEGTHVIINILLLLLIYFSSQIT